MARGLLGGRDPEGYYLVPVRRDVVGRIVEGLAGVELVEAGDVVLVRTRSRRVAIAVARRAERLGGLV